MTLIADKLRSAGAETASARLYALGAESLRGTRIDVSRALPVFIEAIRAESGIVAALLGENFFVTLRAPAREWLADVARDMRGAANISSSGDTPGGAAQTINDSHRCAGRAKNSEGDAASPFPREGSGGDQFDAGGHMTDVLSASAPSPGRAAQAPFDSHDWNGGATGTPSPKPSFRDEVRAANALAGPSIYDSLKVRDGTPIGDLPYRALPRMIGANAREAALLRLILNHVQPHDPRHDGARTHRRRAIAALPPASRRGL